MRWSVLLCLVSWVSVAQVPVPDDVKLILEKVRTGKPPTDAERKRLREWQSTDSQSGTSAQPTADVAAIQEKMSRGVKPTAAELATLRAWAEKVQQNKGALLQEFGKERDALEGSVPAENVPRGEVKSPFIETWLTITQTEESTTPCSDPTRGRARTVRTTKGTFKVRLRASAEGKAMSVTGEPPRTGPWRLQLMDITGAPATLSVQSLGNDCEQTVSGTQSLAAMLPPAEFYFPGPKQRPLVNMVLLSMSPDVAAPNSPWMKVPVPELKAAAASATFVLDGEALRTAMLARKFPKVRAEHASALKVGEALTNVKTVFSFEPYEAEPKVTVVGAEANGGESDEAWKIWLPRPWLERADEAKWFDLKAKDPSVLAHALIKVKSGTSTFKVTLDEVSHWKGIADNFPLEGDEQPDLKLMNPDGGAWVIAADGQSATLDKPVDSVSIDIAAFDTAASGKLVVRAESLDTYAFHPSDGKWSLSLPRDANDNHVADEWERTEGINLSTLSPTWDEEAEPASLVAQTGDGIGLWEEYRGAVVREVTEEDDAARFRRLSPRKKKIFISDQTTGEAHRAVKLGVPLFVSGAGVTVWDVPEKFLKLLPTRSHASWLTWNTPAEMDAHHHPSIAGLSGSFTVAVPFSQKTDQPKPDDWTTRSCVYATTHEVTSLGLSATQMPRAPFDVEVLPLFPENGKACSDARAKTFVPGESGLEHLRQRGLDLNAYRAKVAANEAKSRFQLMVLGVIHEFSHAMGLHHHGDDKVKWHSGTLTCPTRYTDGNDLWDFPNSLLEWKAERGAWVPPSYQKTLEYQALDFGDPIDKTSDEWADFLSKLKHDLVLPPGDWHRPWKLCTRCQQRAHLWTVDGVPFVDQTPD